MTTATKEKATTKKTQVRGHKDGRNSKNKAHSEEFHATEETYHKQAKDENTRTTATMTTATMEKATTIQTNESDKNKEKVNIIFWMVFPPRRPLASTAH